MEKVQPTTFVIFGGTGDLAQNKLIPALFDLKLKKCLPKDYKIFAFARRELSDNQYREFASNALKNKNNNYNADDVAEFLNRIFYVRGDVNELETYENLANEIKKSDDKSGTCSNRIFYLAVSPGLYEPIFINLEKSGISKNCTDESDFHWTRILVEKPFGENPQQAQKLDKLLGKLFEENQIFRIDHYLAKEVLQNIITFRFSNPIFAPVWNKDHIERIELSLFEDNDASDRGHFYDPIGALLDVGQNHILQMLALITMEDPGGLSADKIREARSRILKELSPYEKDVSKYAFRGQYEGYKNEEGVADDSETDTFFQLKLKINNKRWKNVPIYLQSGKALGQKLARIKVVLKPVESCVCPANDICHYGNEITIEIQPEEKISVQFWSKKPGLSFGLESRDLSFKYDETNIPLSDAYEKVLYDCILGDQSLFNSTDEVLAQWNIINKISKEWQKIPLEVYKKGIYPNELLKLE